MTRAKKSSSRLTKALLETAEGTQKSGLLSRATYDKITLRQGARVVMKN